MLSREIQILIKHKLACYLSLSTIHLYRSVKLHHNSDEPNNVLPLHVEKKCHCNTEEV